ncbi:MAG: hypothetical protein ACK4EY_14520 [Flavipsychrobacter sp.]
MKPYDDYADLQYEGLPEGMNQAMEFTDEEKATITLLQEQLQELSEQTETARAHGNWREVAMLEREQKKVIAKLNNAIDKH